jgi:hypothetical protein
VKCRGQADKSTREHDHVRNIDNDAGAAGVNRPTGGLVGAIPPLMLKTEANPGGLGFEQWGGHENRFEGYRRPT